MVRKPTGNNGLFEYTLKITLIIIKYFNQAVDQLIN